jgi:hypothetical protein
MTVEEKKAYDKVYRQKNKARIKEYRESNKEKIKERASLYYKSRKDYYKEYQKHYGPTYYLANKEAIAAQRKEKNKQYRQANKEKARLYMLQKLANNKDYLVRARIANRIYDALKAVKARKNMRTLDYCGCSVAFLMNHLEAQFAPGMSWDNYGEWHIDHIRPCASFTNLGIDIEEQKQCFHYTNLQPLWAEDNLRKSDKWDGN